jgi:hypothetical protein
MPREGSLFEQSIERGARVGGSLASRGSAHFIWSEEVAKIRLLAIGDPLRLRLPAPVMRVRIIADAVQAAMNVRAAMRALISPRNEPFNLNFAATLMADHNFPEPLRN